ncbi:MAG: shikimate dehydrogenase, partial [Candidatus Binatia bacterium]
PERASSRRRAAPGGRTPQMPRHLPISGRTRVVGIIGDPVAHSRSPAMHNAAFAALGLDWVYAPFPVAGRDVRDAVRAVRALGLAGVNVTVPHKEAVLRHLDGLSDLARAVGAVNTIVNRDGQLHGDNTDVAGFALALPPGTRLRGRRAVVIGAGGSARAVLAGLAQKGIGDIVLVNRTLARGRGLARQFGRQVPVIALPLAAAADPAVLREAAVVVNTTSIALGGGAFPPLACTATPADCLFFDLLYGRDTEFLQRARAARRASIDGGEMLVRQGAAALALWTRRRAPLDVMRNALRRKY